MTTERTTFPWESEKFLEVVLDKIQPFDESTSSKKSFLKLMNNHIFRKEILEEFALSQNGEWLKKALDGEVFFILSYPSRKREGFKPYVELVSIGAKEFPCISIYC